jgi:hypothetical protein
MALSIFCSWYKKDVVATGAAALLALQPPINDELSSAGRAGEFDLI